MYWYVKDVTKYYFDTEASKIPVKLSSIQRLEHKFYANKGTEISRMAGMVGDQSDKIEQYLQRGVNAGDLWIIPTNKEKVKHVAPYPRGLVARPVVATCPRGGVVCDPFVGSGTTCLVARELGRSYLGIDLNPDAVQESQERLEAESSQLLLDL
jgi:DNA modification methylase